MSLPTQADVLAWTADRWPDHVTPTWRAMKLGEETGEVLGAVIKSSEGVGGKSSDDIRVETAQVVICAMALAESVGFDIWRAVEAEWERCASREWSTP